MSSSTPPPSQIPVPVNKRLSLTLTTPFLQPSSPLQRPSSASGSRSSSPVIISKPPLSRMAVRRTSLMSLRDRQFDLANCDDPVQLKAQVAKLQYSLKASEQRVTDLTFALNGAAPFSRAGKASPRPWTPVNEMQILPESEAITPSSTFTPGSDLVPAILEQGASTITTEDEGRIPRRALPKSNSSYDLRSRAMTPGKASSPFNDGRSRMSFLSTIGWGSSLSSGIPQAVVSHAVTMSNSPHHGTPSQIPRPTSRGSQSPGEQQLLSPFLGDSPRSPAFINGLGPPSEGRLSPGFKRSTSGSAASTKVIDGLQTELANVRAHLEKVKMEYKSCQRLVGSLTRQTEDLKETRERMRVQCEGLNNVIARKERQLQEMLERARTAESALNEQLSTRKALEQSTKKSLQQMKTELVEAQANQHKAESECASLRDGVKSLRDVWAREVKAMRAEWRKGQDRTRQERDESVITVNIIQKGTDVVRTERASIQMLADTSSMQSAAVGRAFRDKIAGLRGQIDKSMKESQEANATAKLLADELSRLRRLMRDTNRRSTGHEEGRNVP
ncbi:hypothetical protein M231_02927 [Tremella mesenterica]|uniref:SWI5-dependent HO expression protein 3 n=1 Tax=Tremella mesenterica TaxID=5217 RepID=A0A4Q1BPC3_TREME|nr:hypothetical protein M231_02927 [Tremella mesenterica]